MKRYILIIAIASWLSSMGQSCPDITNNSTDPANPSDWRGNDPVINPFINLDPNMIDARFDWTSSIQEWFKPSGNPGFPSCPVASPFLETSHKQNVDHLYHSIPALQDNKAADGWELITFGFGKDKLGLVQSNFSHPRIVLYNKHTGILRVFYYLREPNFTSEYDAITIKLSFMGSDGDKESANFNHMEEVARPIDLYRKGQHEQVPNKLYTGLDPQSPCSARRKYI